MLGAGNVSTECADCYTFLGSRFRAWEELLLMILRRSNENIKEAVIKMIAYSSAPPGIVSFALVLWGLRKPVESAVQL